MLETRKAYEHILFERDGVVAYVTMNRPSKRNALSLEHMRDLISCFKEIGESKDLSVVILRGSRSLGDGRARAGFLPSPLRRLL
jgi:enoyl-CoA hydratase/carnithine racemase